LKRSDPEQAIIKPATILRWLDTDLALTPAPINDPVLNAARKVVIRLAQTKIELPKNGASTRDATSCRPMLSMPRQNTNKNNNADIGSRYLRVDR
jgi:hypothetical protein